MEKDMKEIDYRKAGVDREEGYRTVSLIRESCDRTRQDGDGVLAGLGSFGSLFAMPASYKEPVLVSGTDGVGTKLELAILLDRLEGIGIDCVAMCVNDILCHGARPLFFLDYLATGKLEAETMARVVEGVSLGCIQAECALVGGETAEMPGLYRAGDFDVAGFSVGVVERKKLIDGSGVRAGDTLIALASSGPHSNGFSLIRMATADEKKDGYRREIGGKSLGELLLEPTMIYVKALRPLIEDSLLHGIAHITGGGLFENLPRTIPGGLAAEVERGLIRTPEVFAYLASLGIGDEEMFRTFNMGVGMVLVVSPGDADGICSRIEASGIDAYPIGRVVAVPDSDKGGERLWLR
ncbi:phosphoribosylformylglycinamidine cyclo-ligase [Sediminispirochaeta smaragdinae]|uniref:Phosphoribosylformylglycinamidine cyclo-ligase n=2 Tax=Sediminispirochaeta TaxID=1911556 RepID=E1R4Y4_SEDSS|nr:phosphoribosylformylglycinamidine cyclo-ligase [Sediminispirochaeta smaragdinae DSM 11293]